MSRAVIQEQFGGPEVLEVRDVAEPHAGPGEVRVRVSAAGLNAADWKLAGSAEAAGRFDVTLPAGFGNDFAGVVNEVGDGVTGFAAGDRVYGGAPGSARSRTTPSCGPAPTRCCTPRNSVDDITASTLAIAGRTADAVVSAIGVRAGDTVLIGGAAGGVGVFAVQLRGARAPRSWDGAAGGLRLPARARRRARHVRRGLARRVRALAPQGVTAAADLTGTETARAAVELGVSPGRIATIAAASPPDRVRATGGRDATPGALERIAAAIAAGEFVVPIAATFPIEQTPAAVELQRAGHVHPARWSSPSLN